MQTQFHIRMERAIDCETDRQRLYVIVTEQDGLGNKEGDIWIPVEQMPRLIHDLQTFISEQAA